MDMCECPPNTSQIKAPCYRGVFVNVTWVVIVDEIVVDRLAKDSPCDCDKTDAKRGGYPVTVGFAEPDWLKTDTMRGRTGTFQSNGL